MSYARFGANGSDVYVFGHVGGFIQCCGCRLGDNWNFHSIPEIVAHMHEHVDAGHTVPEDLLDPDTYDEGDFTAMCYTFMCRESEGHDGPHTPTDERGERIRANAEAQKFEALLRTSPLPSSAEKSEK